jgi:hypothetical protein
MENTAGESSFLSVGDRVNQLVTLLEREIANHQSTHFLYTQALQSAMLWEQECTRAMAHAEVARITTSTYEVQIKQLRTENQRLNLVINHLVSLSRRHQVDIH